MARSTPLWQQSGTYSAQLDRQLISSIWPAGGVQGGAVTATAATMDVSIAAGTAAVPLQPGQGCGLCRWDAAEVVTLDAAPPSGQSRIDLVAVQYRDSAFDGGADNDFVMVNVTGTPAAANPVVPDTPANAYVLATVTVPGGVANLDTATITTRSTPLIPGTAPPFGLIGLGSSVSNIGGAAITLTPMNNGVVLRNGMTSPSNNLVVPLTGLYRIAWQIMFLASGATQYTQAQVYRNGTQNQTATGFSTASGQYVSYGGTQVQALNANDALTLVGISPGSVSTAAAGVSYTWLEAQFLMS